VEWIIVVAVLLVLGLWVTGQRRRRHAVEELGVYLAAASPAAVSQTDEEQDLEEGALDADELEREPSYCDEGADDERD
jgi:hypothetical protein